MIVSLLFRWTDMQKRKRTGVICVRDGLILAIELEDPATKERFWSFPGGGIEPGETPEATAIRETLEETGYQVTLAGSPFVNHYLFRWNAELYDCTTYWYKADLEHETRSRAEDTSYLLRAEWLRWPRSRSLFLYNPAITEVIDHFLPTG